MRIIGHRGARNIWAENSLSGFRSVCALGVDAVELDVHLSSDGEIMVIHDPLLERTTDHTGPVAHLSRAALAKVTLDDTLGETIGGAMDAETDAAWRRQAVTLKAMIARAQAEWTAAPLAYP